MLGFESLSRHSFKEKQVEKSRNDAKRGNGLNNTLNEYRNRASDDAAASQEALLSEPGNAQTIGG